MGNVVSFVAGSGEEPQKLTQFLAFAAKCCRAYILGSSLSENSKRQLPTKVAKPSRSLEEDYETFNVNRKQHSRVNRPIFSKIKLIGFARILRSSQYIDGRGSYSLLATLMFQDIIVYSIAYCQCSATLNRSFSV